MHRFGKTVSFPKKPPIIKNQTYSSFISCPPGTPKKCSRSTAVATRTTPIPIYPMVKYFCQTKQQLRCVAKVKPEKYWRVQRIARSHQPILVEPLHCLVRNVHQAEAVKTIQSHRRMATKSRPLSICMNTIASKLAI